ncbi:MAG: hypothetical protein ABWZ03_00240, partial [Solirubrobacterales bacterium]
QQSLASAVTQLPDFMRQFDTTAVNLRAALDDVQPLINATRPVAQKLQPFTKRLRGFARDSVPTVQGLSGIIKAPGAANDLIELTRLQDPLAEIGVGPVNRHGSSRPGALPASADSLEDSLDQVSTLRAYSPDLTGWFDDFGHSGFPDAFGGIGRISTTLNTFSVGAPSSGVPCNSLLGVLTATPGIPGFDQLRSQIGQLCQPLSGSDLLSGMGIKYLERCPGSNERGLTSDQLTQGGRIDCNPDQVPVGP